MGFSFFQLKKVQQKVSSKYVRVADRGFQQYPQLVKNDPRFELYGAIDNCHKLRRMKALRAEIGCPPRIRNSRGGIGVLCMHPVGCMHVKCR